MGELTLLLQNVILQVDTVDRWLWSLESSHVFSVCIAYNYMTFQPPIVSTVDVSSLWHKYDPLKVVLCAWRFFRDRLPTKDNLLRHGVIGNDDMLIYPTNFCIVCKYVPLWMYADILFDENIYDVVNP